MDRRLGTCVFMCVVQLRDRESSTGFSGIIISTVAAGLLLAVCLKCSLTFHCLNTDVFLSIHYFFMPFWFEMTFFLPLDIRKESVLLSIYFNQNSQILPCMKGK